MDYLVMSFGHVALPLPQQSLPTVSVIQIWDFWGAAAPATRRSSGRTGGRAGTPFSDAFLNEFFIFRFVCWGSTSPNPIFSGLKFQVECSTNHVWGPRGDRDMANLVKHVLFAKDVFGETHG